MKCNQQSRVQFYGVKEGIQNESYLFCRCNQFVFQYLKILIKTFEIFGEILVILCNFPTIFQA